MFKFLGARSIFLVVVTSSTLFLASCPLLPTSNGDPSDPVVPGDMISIPAGSFEMGDPWAEGSWDQLPVHTVNLSAYEIDKYEITNQEYIDILNWANGQGYLTTASSSLVTAYGMELLEMTAHNSQIGYSGGQFVNVSVDGFSMADHPVVFVTWYGAAAYCNWLSESQGLQPCYNTSTWECDFSQNGYHLPTEAQWERAAAWDPSGSGRHFRYGNGSDIISCSNANFYDTTCCNPLAIPSACTSPVGYYASWSSPAGCYDMSGNAWEWCNDWCLQQYTASTLTDPTGPSTGSYRMYRGGSCRYQEHHCRSAYRACENPGIAIDSLGFRVAR